MTDRRRVAVTGIGVVNPFGGDAQDFFTRLVRGESAITLYQQLDSPTPLNQPVMRCPQFDATAAIGPSLAAVTDRFSQLGLAAAFDAWADAALPRHDGGADDFGVSWGTGVGGTLTFERGYGDFYARGKERAAPLSVVMAMNNAAASLISIELGLGGACLTHSVACASSAIAIGEGMRRIQSGEARVMVTGGSEAPLSFSVMRAWEAMRVVARADEHSAPRACRPFQASRTGLVLSEGAAALVLEDWGHAQARGARIYCELAGYGQSSDHAHLVKPDSRGQVRAIRAAMLEAGLGTADVGYVNAHGTATREGDPVEIAALREVFGEHAATLPVSATKSMHGHLLGASAALEAAITVLAIARREIPPTARFEEAAPDCAGVCHVADGLHDVPMRSALSNSFAFGGSNAVLAFKAEA